MFIRYNVPGIIWAIVIYILCAIPGYALPHYRWADLVSFDKFVHASIFGLLSLLCIRGFKKQHQFSSLQMHAVIFAVLFTIGYGGFLELLQTYFFTGRSGSWFDFIANSFGAFMSILVFRYLIQKKFKLFGNYF